MITVSDNAHPYQRVTAKYRDMIEAGQLKPGDHLPSVREIVADSGISHATAAKVVAQLKAEGYVTTSTGATGGTVVAARAPSTGDYVRAIRSTGKIYTRGAYARITAAELVAAEDVPAAALGVEPGDQVIRRARITCNSDGVPQSASVSYFPGTFAQAAPMLLVAERIEHGTPGYLAAQTGRTLGATKEQLAAATATTVQAADLDVEPGSAVLLGRNWIYDDAGAVLEYGESVSVQGRWLTFESPA